MQAEKKKINCFNLITLQYAVKFELLMMSLNELAGCDSFCDS